MRHVNFYAVTILMLFLSGCTSQGCKPDKGTVLKGTDTAIIGLYLDGNAYPQATVDKVIVHPGQKIILAGPEKFDILFKDQKSPIGRLEIQSSNGIVVIEIPKDIFERNQRESKTTDMKKELVYRYGIRVNGKVTDPEIVIRR